MNATDAAAPTPTLHRAEYARRMNRVLDHIDRHLDAPLDLAQLADVANFSRFHFHRVFAAWMGETLGDYARRRRLEYGAFLLSTRPADAVLQIALATGFGSGEAFARAFKQKFGCTPTVWRATAGDRRQAEIRDRHQRRPTMYYRPAQAFAGQADSNPDQAGSNPGQAPRGDFRDHDGFPSAYCEPAMNVTLIDLPATRVAYLRKIGPYGPAIGEFWRGVVKPWMLSHGLEHAECFGVGLDDPSITPPAKCRYDACVAVPDGFQAGGQALLTTLPGGRYAAAAFNAPPSQIADAWMTLCREWLPGSGLQCDERPLFERFRPADQDPASGRFVCELCVPVRAL